MVLDQDGCFRAMRAHDSRFDGVFFVGIHTTGIYCRPICPARPAKRESCRFFDTAALAERDGYRPCLRCRPELAPGNARIDAVGRLAAGTLARIEAGALNERSVDDLAAEFGVTARHLRRAVEAEFGVSPVEIAQTQRLLLAKQLLTGTPLSVTEIAYASGFASLRRFNALFQERYRLSPTKLRGRRAIPASDSIVCEFGYRPPFDWSGLLQFLSHRAIPGVESVEAGVYSRLVSHKDQQAWVRVSPHPTRPSLRAEVPAILSPVLVPTLAKLKRLFDLSAHPLQIGEHLSQDDRLKPLVQLRPGLRVPGAFDGFEMSLRAILGQQVSVKAARTLAGRFAVAFPGLVPARIAASDTADLRKLGLTNARADSILALARAVDAGRVSLDAGVDPGRTMERLKELPGIGEWTAQYIAMRALSWPDAFPHTDLGIYKALGTRSGSRVLEIGKAWSPWRSYAVMHLWKSLEAK